MSERLSLLVVADDLTGANDTAVSFADVGYGTVLVMSPAALEGADASATEVFAVSSDSRPVGELARQLTADTVRRGVAAGIERLYLKIDSTMRGSVADQVAGALDAWSQLHPDAVALVCSAYPAMGRTLVDGVLRVNGVDVDQTPSGRDPVCPVTTPRMAELLPDSVVLPNLGDAGMLAESIRLAGSNQVVVDAATQEDLAVLAQAVLLLGPGAIPVGSAGLSKELAKLYPVPVGEPVADPLLGRSGRALVVVTSIHETSQRQVDRYIGCEDGGNAIVFSPHPAQLLTPIALPALKEQLKAVAPSGPGTVVIRANPASVRTDLDVQTLAQGFADQLAELAAAALRHEPFSALVLFGGDGANATLEAIGAERLQVAYAVAEGVPLCTVLGGEREGLVVITKSGGFGDPDLLATIMKRLEGNPS